MSNLILLKNFFKAVYQVVRSRVKERLCSRIGKDSFSIRVIFNEGTTKEITFDKARAKIA